MPTTIRSRTYTHRNLLQDLFEIKAVLDVESQLIKALVTMAIERQNAGFKPLL